MLLNQRVLGFLVTALPLLLAEIHGAALVTTETFDGQPAIVLENEFVRAVFVPESGGECRDLVYKPTDKRLILRRTGALFGNRVWNYADATLYRQWQSMAWESQVETLAGEVRLVLRAQGSIDFTRATIFEKSIALRDGESMLRVLTTFHVGQELMNPRTIGLWFHNQVGIPGERNTYAFPLDDGIVTLESGSGDSWFYNPSRGWASMRGESGTGLCFTMEYRRLMCFYLHQGKQPTLEWAFRSVDIVNGESLPTEQTLVLFSGLEAVHGGGGGVVAGFDTPDIWPPEQARNGMTLQAQMTAGTPVKGRLEVILRPLPEGQDVAVHTEEVELRPGAVTSVPLSVTVPRNGSWLLVGSLENEGGQMMDFITSFTVGEASAPVRIPPREERLGRTSERFEDRKPLAGAAPEDLPYSTEIESPHVKWAKPYAGEKPKVLVLTSCIAGREAAELAQRLDMELLWVTAGSQQELNSMGYLLNTPEKSGMKYLVEHMNEGIKKTLTTRECDVVLIGSLEGQLFSEDVVALLESKVAQGMGLVYVAPNQCSDRLYSLLPVEKEIHPRHRNGEWEPVADVPHFITAGIPFDALPRTDYVRYQPSGQVLATIGKRYPLAVVQEGPGNGRVVVFSYNTGWQGVGKYSSGITPWVEDAGCRFEYWEYHFSLLAKGLLWAAQKETPLLVTEVSVEADAEPPSLLFGTHNSAEATRVTARIRLSNALGHVEHTERTELSINSGLQGHRLALFEHLSGGMHLVDVTLLDAQDRVLTWGSAAFETQRPVRFAGIDFDSQAYEPGDTAKATVRLVADDAGPHAVRVLAEFTDALGRLLFREQREVICAGETTLLYSLPVGTPLCTTATLRVQAAVDGKPSAVDARQVITFPPEFAQRGHADWEHRIWGNAAGSYDREYISRVRASRLKDFEVDCVLTSASWMNEREYEWPVRLGFRIMPMNVAHGFISVGHRVPKGKMTFQEQRTAYQKTMDKQYLVRPVCLSDPEELAPLAEKLHTLAEYAGWLKPSDYNLGDEMSTTYYVTAMDYDFAPAALEAFRAWLQDQYKTLPALNAGWETDFASWDAVMPMTAEEVKGRGNYAPWADHREFMDVSFCHFFDWIRAELRKRDPGARVSMSGSQAAEAYGGYDWTRLVKALDFLQNYTHQNTAIMHRSFGPDLPRAPWYGYGAFNPSQRRALWWRLFSGNFGGSYFSLVSIFNPDFTYSGTAAQALPIIREFKSGISLLLKNCDRQSEIGIHYSHASIRGAFISGTAAVFRENRNGWIQVVQDLGFQCEMLSTAQIEAGELAMRQYKAFVLPYSVAISEKEAEAFRDYVAAGGLLLADAKTGLMDLHCRTLAEGQLDTLFGVSRPHADPLTPSREGHVRFTADMGACRLKDLGFDISVTEPTLALAGGQPLGTHGDVPVGIVQRSGKGVAVVLNLLLDSFPQRRNLGIEKPLREAVRNLLLLQGLTPTVEVSVEADPAAEMFTVRYRSGNALYVGSVMDPGKQKADWSAPVRIRFPATGHLYDVRSKAYLGHVTETATELLAGDACLYAVLPYRVEKVSVRTAGGAKRQADSIAFDIAVQAGEGKPGLHVVAVEVSGPDGVPRRHYGARLLAPDGRVRYSVDTALNDAPGEWTVRVSDVATGITGSSTFQLLPLP